MNAHRVLESLPDILKTIPELLGYTPRESLILLPVHGQESAALIRVDLPNTSHYLELDEYAACVLDYLLRLREISAVYVAVFTSEPESGRTLPHAPTVAHVSEAANRVGIRVAAAACVHPTGWADYLSEQTGPLEEVRSEIEAVLAENLSELIRIEPAAMADRHRVATLREHHRELATPTDDEVLCAWQLYLDGVNCLDTAYEPILIALIATGLERPRTRELLVANGIFGAATAQKVEQTWLDFAGCVTETELAGITEIFADLVPADLARAEHAICVLRNVAAHVEAAEQRHALAALAWLHCLCGHASKAVEYARAALRRGHEELAGVVLERVETGYVPGWIDGTSCRGQQQLSSFAHRSGEEHGC